MKINEIINPYASNFIPIHYRRLNKAPKSKRFVEGIGRSEKDPKQPNNKFIGFSGRIIDYHG